MRKLKFIFILLWVISAVWISLCESGIIVEGYFKGSVEHEYGLMMLSAITALGGSFLACRLFAFAYVREQLTAQTDAAPALLRWNKVRLAILSAAIFPSLVIYYGTLNNSSLYAFLIAITASLFCWPSDN